MEFSNPQVYAPAILGVLLILFEYFSYKSNKSFYSSNVASEKIKILYRFKWVLGICLSITSFFFFRNGNIGSHKFLIVGFLFVAAGFDEKMRDYVSFITVPAIIANAILWFKFTHCIMYLIKYLKFAKVKNKA